MPDVWRLPAITPWEKTIGKHPTQKTLSLLCRIILASTLERAWVLDPFAESSTTGIATNLANRRYLGIEKEAKFAQIGANRRQAMEQEAVRAEWTAKLKDWALAFADSGGSLEQNNVAIGYPRCRHFEADVANHSSRHRELTDNEPTTVEVEK
jgi:site-specific DNA-methyltransferase (adenine-specific)